MAMQDTRNDAIRENIPKLIKALRGNQDNEEITRKHESFAWSTFRTKRHLDTNSHEIRRKIDGFKEKFQVDNFPEYAEHLVALSDEIIHHAPYVNHYEVDVQWSILDFLLTMAYNPTRTLRKNIDKINLMLPSVTIPNDLITQEQIDIINWRREQEKEFIPMTWHHDNSDDSDLSDWSVDGDDPANITIHTGIPSNVEEDSLEQKNEEKIIRLLPHLPPLKPPEKEPSYVLFDPTTSKNLHEHVQHSWWLPDSYCTATIDSARWEANFNEHYIHYISDLTNNLMKLDIPDTVNEYCLQREIIWMFHSPQKCKFFNYNHNADLIEVMRNVTVPSVTTEGIFQYLNNNFRPSLQMMHNLRQFIDTIYINKHFTPPKTIECYAASLKHLLVPIQLALLEYEQRLIEQKAGDILTIIQLHEFLRPSMRMLRCIYELHEQVLLPMKQHPAHICSAYLLASLINCHLNANSSMEANLASSLFLGSVKIFCIIIDTWWCEGRLEDWQEEFLVENESNHNVQVRKYTKDKTKAFFVPEFVSKCIKENRLFLLLLEHTLEAGCTLNLLYEINRINDLRIACTDIQGQLYNLFLADIMQRVTTMNTPLNETPPPPPVVEEYDSGFINEIHVPSNDIEEIETINIDPTSTQLIPDVCQTLTSTDNFLLMAFGCPLDSHANSLGDNVSSSNETNSSNNDINALDIYEKLQMSNSILPMEEMILESLSGILQIRTASVNEFVMHLYRDEFKILYHLRNIRKVLLLEASDLMHQFYIKILLQIESSHSLPNPYLLSIQLDDILCNKFPDLNGLFRVKTNPDSKWTDKIFEAIDDITINYNLNSELSHIITLDDMAQYNLIFRFLVKVKWGLLALENLKFPRVQKRNTCEKLEMIELMMRRLEQLRFWMMYAMQSVHFHLMTHVLQSMGEKLDDKIMKCRNLKEMETIHKSYLEIVCEHCLLSESQNTIKLGVDQLLNLVLILRMEWNQCKQIMNRDHPLATASDDDNDDDDSTIDNATISNISTKSDSAYKINDQIDAIEVTYIRCHQYLASKLNNEVYLHQKHFLSGLSDAFNTSMPH